MFGIPINVWQSVDMVVIISASQSSSTLQSLMLVTNLDLNLQEYTTMGVNPIKGML